MRNKCFWIVFFNGENSNMMSWHKWRDRNLSFIWKLQNKKICGKIWVSHIWLMCCGPPRELSGNQRSFFYIYKYFSYFTFCATRQEYADSLFVDLHLVYNVEVSSVGVVASISSWKPNLQNGSLWLVKVYTDDRKFYNMKENSHMTYWIHTWCIIGARNLHFFSTQLTKLKMNMQISTTAQTFLSQKSGQLATIRNIRIFGKWDM